jgi:nitrite reductase/ring-hydroxylating ferredoxin subunit/ketosteroid isomerase-like protein
MTDVSTEWVPVGTVADVAKRKKVVVPIGDRQVLVVAHDDRFFAFDNICVHRERELSKGVILNGKLVCPGHQWAFALETGWEAVKEMCQPTFPVRVNGDVVEVQIETQVETGALDVAGDGADDDRSVRDWIDAWGREVAAVDLAAGRRRFAADVSAFGTHADVVVGRDALEEAQWSRIWPAIEAFAFLTDEMQVIVSPDRLQAVAVVGWTSQGIAADGNRFDRPGRATVVLRRDAPAGDWVGVHTHFSLARGVPQTTHGSRVAIR